MNRFTGRSGEKRFSALCSDAGVTCNEPREDDHGWDHVVEFPHVPQPGVTADLQRALPAVFVQTKSHEEDGLTVTMSLSNAVKLARSPNPCFVALASLEPNRRSTGWHVVHFWGALIGRVLTRVREASRDGVEEADFNHRSFSFTMTAADAHDDRELLGWMRDTVAAAGPDYAAAKSALHPGEDVVGNLSIGPLGSVDELIEHSLGLTPTLPIKEVSLARRRFDVDLPMDVPVQTATTVALHAQPVDRCVIRMRGPDGLEVEVEGDVIVPAIPGLPEDRMKYRLRSDVIDIVWSPAGESKVSGHISGDRRQSPADLERMLRVASWAGQGPIDVRVTVGDDPVLGATVNMGDIDDRDHLAYLAEIAGPLARVAARLRQRVPSISLDELGQSPDAELFYSFITATETTSSTNLDEATPLPDVDAGVAFGIVQVGGWAFAAIQRMPIKSQTRNGDEWRINFGAPLLLEGYAFEVTDGATLERLKADHRRLAGAQRTLPLDNAVAALRRTAS